MIRHDLEKLLKENPYPGRGIILGRSGDGRRVILVYFIMGRSENSRNRIFEKTGDGIRTKAFDPVKMTDPSLVIYNPVRVINGRTIVSNGDQTDTICEYLQNGLSFRDALLTREFEPDRPNYTPRISGIIEQNGGYCLSILKTADGGPSACMRAFFEYSQCVPGLGHFLSTYKTDGDPLPSFEGEPVRIEMDVSAGLKKYTETIWEALNNENKVSLYAREIVISTGEATEVIINKNV